MSDELRRCKRCGGEGIPIDWAYEDGTVVYWVQCSTDWCYETKSYATPEEAVAEWNEQTEEEKLRAELAAAQAETERLRAQLESARAWIPQWAQDDPAEDAVWKQLGGDDE